MLPLYIALQRLLQYKSMFLVGATLLALVSTGRPVFAQLAETEDGFQYFSNEPVFVAIDFEEALQSEGSAPSVPVALQDPVAPVPPGADSSYGEELEDFNIQFLRSASVLLKPGQHQLDVGLVYAKNDYNAPISLAPSGVARVDFRQRSLFVPLAFRYGITERTQVSIAAPLGWANTEVSSVGLFDQSTSNGGIGDTELGVNYHLRKGCYQHLSPDVILSLGLTLPTGDGQFPFNGLTDASLGNGVWATSIQLLCINRYDPVIVYYGVGYRHQYEDTILGQDIFFGDQISYNLGVGFAVNDRITFSTSFLGIFQTETILNGVGVPGTLREPLRLRFAMTAYRCGKIIEPFAEIGMTPDAPDSVIGIVWTY
ncbi:hypothetical protein [Blastopirellula marina]|uniref:Uncharacterized protein n=1 Tax=Blastopirellula marina DSM 3645 TaxID=314230 RepID=A3ZTN5_9BACT|nr:hypothetical protein [Blastopirellula marina]EAQ80273.1 hypothetical protein DSM3645_19793 [Blastopirellula marina DSM 3645]